MKKNFNVFLMQLNAKLHDEGNGEMNVTIQNPSTSINARINGDPPYLIIGISIVCGILLLALVIYILYKCGFFKRAKKDAIKSYRQSIRVRGPPLLEEECDQEVLEDKPAVANNCNEMVMQLKAAQKLKNLSNEDIVAEEVKVPNQPKPSTSRNRESFRTVNSITLDVNKK